MTSWPAVRWSSADQIIAAIGDLDGPPPPESAVEPAAWYRSLVDSGQHFDALNFIAYALPRYECVVWATRAVLDSGVSDRTGELMRAIMRWIDDPQEAHRRRVESLIPTVRSDRPEYLLAMAVFHSGGSISGPDLPAILPPPEMTARMGATAVLNAAGKDRSKSAAILQHAVKLGEEIAASGPTR